MRVGETEVRKLAALAKLEFAAEQLPALQRDLEAILDYVEALQAVDTEGVPPTAHVAEFATPLRPDDSPRALPVDEVVRSAPRSADGALVVPRIVE